MIHTAVTAPTKRTPLSVHMAMRAATDLGSRNSASQMELNGPALYIAAAYAWAPHTCPRLVVSSPLPSDGSQSQVGRTQGPMEYTRPRTMSQTKRLIFWPTEAVVRQSRSALMLVTVT